MSVSEYPKVLVSEVGPRDGLQSIQAVMPTAGKLRWITALAAAGLREIEVGSFVPARLLPQMADVREVVAHALAIPGLHVAALAPNLRGAEGAFEAGVHKLTLPVSVTEAHSLANIRKTPAQMIDEVRAIVALRNERFPSVQIEAGVSVAFGCTIAGAVSDDETIAMAVAMAAPVGMIEVSRLYAQDAGSPAVPAADLEAPLMVQEQGAASGVELLKQAVEQRGIEADGLGHATQVGLARRRFNGCAARGFGCHPRRRGATSDQRNGRASGMNAVSAASAAFSGG